MKSYQYASNPDLKSNALLSKKAASEGIVLLKNKSALPIKDTKNIALLGVTSYDFISGGTGSGDVNEAYSVSLEEGLRKLNYKINSWIYYSEKGELVEKRNYKVLNVRSMVIPGDDRMVKKSVADGKWIKYSEYDQSIKSEENYYDGKLNGECSYYFPGGIIPNRIINYKNGLLDGKYQNFSRKL